MLPQVLNARIHQLQGVQGAAASLRLHGCMSGGAVKTVADLIVGHGVFGGHTVHFAGMPGKCHVYVVKHMSPGHKAFAGAALFRRTAKVDDRAGQFIFRQVTLDGQSSPQ